MAVCFATGEACLVSVIVLNGASPGGSGRITALSNSSLYLGFVVASLLAPAAHERLGSDRRALVVGLAGLTLYAMAKASTVQVLHLLGATAAGMSGALVWTAEGAFLAKLARIDAACEPSVPLSVAAAKLAGMLASILPCALTAAKLLASAVLLPLGGNAPSAVRILFAAYAALGALSALGMHLLVVDPKEGMRGAVACTASAAATAAIAPAVDELRQPARAGGCGRTAARVRATLALNLSAEMALLAPNNVAFGLATGNMPLYGARIVVRTLGVGHVGWLFALSGIVSAAAAGANGGVSSWRARAASTTAGALSFALTGMLSAWLAMRLHLDAPRGAPASVDGGSVPVAWICTLFVLYGHGMAVWQGVTMAEFAQRFDDDPSIGFANLKLHSGLASALAFYAFDALGPVVAGCTCAAWALLGGCCFLLLGPGRARGAATGKAEGCGEGAAHSTRRDDGAAEAIELGAVRARAEGRPPSTHSSRAALAAMEVTAAAPADADACGGDPSTREAAAAAPADVSPPVGHDGEGDGTDLRPLRRSPRLAR
ncbi:hypothetical protein KFE25_004249 [Diacronema lutheri]|uniref:Uncharacterized protein n=1 Tax=Diacronema lutheri TaxID=2081491 RepID=A0A8J6C6C6_DIALT|nr:hypothetical protein KFE25_004249 [Diacronema lutheri]